MRTLLTPKQVARAIGASEASLKRWCDKGMLSCVRTAGGHRRLPLSEVVQFLRRNGHVLVRPEILGLPPTSGCGELVIERAVRQVALALRAHDEPRLRAQLFDLYLAGQSIVAICDQVLAPVFRLVGEQWEHGDVQIYEERRSCELCLRVLADLRAVLAPPAESAPRAIGGTIAGDHYALPTAMVELVLRELGWQAHSYGQNLPLSAWRRALTDERPALLWLSVSSLESADGFVPEYNQVFEEAARVGARVAVGGRALGEDLRRQMRYSAYCDNLQHLADFAGSLYAPPREPTRSVDAAGRPGVTAPDSR